MKNVCIIGFGRAGKIQMNALKNICNVVAVIDIKSSCESDLNMYNSSTEFDRDINRAFQDDIDAVVVTTPTYSHFEICKNALQNDKHVFVEKPLANELYEYKELYDLAYSHNKLLFIGFNRRYDPEWLNLYSQLDGNIPLHINVICRDHPFPPASYLKSCGGIFKDCVVHDIDMICYMLSSYPDTVDCSMDECGETASTNLIFSLNDVKCRVNMIHSRHSPRYEQFVSIYCKDGCFQMGRDQLDLGTSFNERYKDSYDLQMKDFIRRLNVNDPDHNITLSHSLQMERILEACNKSATTGDVQHLKSLRAYDEAETNVKKLYETARKFHTPCTVRRLRETYAAGKQGLSLSIWEVMDKLKKFKDISDPDVDVPNDQHALQTAEAIRKAGHPRWMQLVGLIHDFGKILYLWGNADDGTSMDTQFSLVGDTFIVGHKYPDELIYPEFNPNEGKSDETIYDKSCGLDNCLVSYGHDEYLYQVLKHSNAKLPEHALKMVRYHSLYVWHDKDAYSELENEYDVLVKGWVKLFNQYDLYSKRNKPINIEDVKSYYSELSYEYLPNGLCF